MAYNTLGETMNNSISFQLLKLQAPLIIDIRDKARYDKGHIPGAISVPMSELTKNPSKYLNFTSTYYIYCEFGYRSKRVREVLLGLGYHVVDITDGYYGYEAYLSK